MYSLSKKDFIPFTGLINYTIKGNKDIDDKIIELGSQEDLEFLIGQTKLLFYNSAVIGTVGGLVSLLKN